MQKAPLHVKCIIMAPKIRGIPTVCPACFLALLSHVGSQKSGVSVLTGTFSIVCVCSSASALGDGAFSPSHAPLVRDKWLATLRWGR